MEKSQVELLEIRYKETNDTLSHRIFSNHIMNFDNVKPLVEKIGNSQLLIKNSDGETPLHYAITNPCVPFKDIKEWLDKENAVEDKQSLELPSNDGSTLLHAACLRTPIDVELIKFLIEKLQLDPNALNKEKVTPLLYACQNEDINFKAIKLLADAMKKNNPETVISWEQYLNAVRNNPNEKNYKPFQKNQENSISYLDKINIESNLYINKSNKSFNFTNSLEKKAENNHGLNDKDKDKDKDGNTQLHLACIKIATDFQTAIKYIKLALENGVDPLIENNKGQTPFQLAKELIQIHSLKSEQVSIYKKISAIFGKFLQKNIIKESNFNNDKQNLIEKFVTLMNNGFDIDSINENSKQSWFEYIESKLPNNHPSTIEKFYLATIETRFINYLSDSSALNFNKLKTLSEKHSEKFQKFLNFESLLETPPIYHLVRAKANLDCFEWLLSIGCDFTQKNDEKKTLLHQVCSSIPLNLELINFLLKNKLIINKTDKNDYTPLHYALLNQSVTIDNIESLIKLAKIENEDINLYQTKHSFLYVYCKFNVCKPEIITYLMELDKNLEQNIRYERNCAALESLCKNKHINFQSIQILTTVINDKKDRENINIPMKYIEAICKNPKVTKEIVINFLMLIIRELEYSDFKKIKEKACEILKENHFGILQALEKHLFITTDKKFIYDMLESYEDPQQINELLDKLKSYTIGTTEMSGETFLNAVFATTQENPEYLVMLAKKFGLNEMLKKSKNNNTTFHFAFFNPAISYIEISKLTTEAFVPKEKLQSLKNARNETLLHRACLRTPIDIESCELLLQKGLNPHNKTLANDTPLLLACRNESITLPIIKLFVNAMQEKKITKNALAWEPYLYAICENQKATKEMVNYFIKLGANPHFKIAIINKTSFEILSETHPAIFEELTSNKLHLACLQLKTNFESAIEAIKKSLNEGSNPLIKNNEGKYPFEITKRLIQTHVPEEQQLYSYKIIADMFGEYLLKEFEKAYNTGKLNKSLKAIVILINNGFDIDSINKKTGKSWFECIKEKYKKIENSSTLKKDFYLAVIKARVINYCIDDSEANFNKLNELLTDHYKEIKQCFNSEFIFGTLETDELWSQFIKTVTKFQFTKLCLDSETTFSEFEKLLKEHPAEVIDFMDTGFIGNFPPLHYAARFNEDINIFKLLMKTETTLHRLDQDRCSLLHHACRRRPIDSEIVIFLLEKNLDPVAKDIWGKTPREWLEKREVSIKKEPDTLLESKKNKVSKIWGENQNGELVCLDVETFEEISQNLHNDEITEDSQVVCLYGSKNRYPIFQPSISRSSEPVFQKKLNLINDHKNNSNDSLDLHSLCHDPIVNFEKIKWLIEQKADPTFENNANESPISIIKAKLEEINKIIDEMTIRLEAAFYVLIKDRYEEHCKSTLQLLQNLENIIVEKIIPEAIKKSEFVNSMESMINKSKTYSKLHEQQFNMDFTPPDELKKYEEDRNAYQEQRDVLMNLLDLFVNYKPEKPQIEPLNNDFK